MPEIGVRIANLNPVYDLMMNLSNDGRRYLSMAINDSLRGMKTDITAEVQANVNLTKSFIQKQTGRRTTQTFNIYYASAGRPTGTIVTQGPNIPLVEYSNQRGNRSTLPKSVTVTVKKSRGKTRMSRSVRLDTTRAGRKRLIGPTPTVDPSGVAKMKERYGPRIPDILSNKEVMVRVEEHAKKRLDTNLTKQVDHMLSDLM